MKLAVGEYRAFAEHAPRLLEEPGAAAGRLRWWKDKGVEGVVFYDHIRGFYETDAQRFRAVKAVLDDVGLPVAGFNALRKSLHMPDRAEYEQRRLDRCLEVCEILRPAIFDVSVNAPYPDGLDTHQMAARPLFRGVHARPDSIDRAARSLKAFARRLAGIGAELSVELHDDGIHDTADGCLRLADAIDEPNVGVNPDVGNWYRVPYEHGQSWREQVVKMAPRTNYWEVKNYKRVLVAEAGRAFSWNVDLDDGDIDFREAAVILWRAGFRGWVCNEGGQGDGIRSTLKYIEYMRWILDEWIPTLGSDS